MDAFMQSTELNSLMIHTECGRKEGRTDGPEAVKFPCESTSLSSRRVNRAFILTQMQTELGAVVQFPLMLLYREDDRRKLDLRLDWSLELRWMVMRWILLHRSAAFIFQIRNVFHALFFFLFLLISHPGLFLLPINSENLLKRSLELCSGGICFTQGAELMLSLAILLLVMSPFFFLHP